MARKSKINTSGFWEYSEAKNVSVSDRIILYLLFIIGLAGWFSFARWWFLEKHIEIGWLFGLLSFFFWYCMLRTVFVWFTYINVRKPERIAPPKDLKVAIFTTSYKGEPIEMVRKTLEACSRVTYPHTTYLLDNTEDPAFRKAAEEHGAVWFELLNIPGAKAGKVNRALKMTDEDFVLILDPDHIPFPNFLDNTLGYFTDPDVGFVQVSQAYYNQSRSFIAQAAAEQTYTFYGATEMGYHGIGYPIAIGSNCTFRRAALESIGGHVEGLAEDLQTSLKLHAQGWKSVYNPVVVSRGIVPEDFTSFCKQQLKWAFGAFGVLFVDLPAVFRKLNFIQKIQYIFTPTFYLSGFISFVFMLLPFIYFATGALPANMSMSDFVIYGAWVIIPSILLYIMSQKWMSHSKTERGFHWHSMILTFAIRPVFLYSMFLSLKKAKMIYLPTSKKADTEFSPFAKPMFWYVIIFILSTAGILLYRAFFTEAADKALSTGKVWVMIGFAFMGFIMSVAGIFAARPVKQKWDKDPWDEVDIKTIDTSKDKVYNNN